MVLRAHMVMSDFHCSVGMHVPGIDLSESNFDSAWGRKSLRKMYDMIVTVSAARLLQRVLAANDAHLACAWHARAVFIMCMSSGPVMAVPWLDVSSAAVCIQTAVPLAPCRRLPTYPAVST